MKKLDELLKSDTALNVTFGVSILPGGGMSATLMTKGRGDWINGRGATCEAALDDLLGKVTPAPLPKLPGLE